MCTEPLAEWHVQKLIAHDKKLKRYRSPSSKPFPGERKREPEDSHQSSAAESALYMGHMVRLMHAQGTKWSEDKYKERSEDKGR